ncbi:hypothetical protein [Hanstruepera ponticola]|uniref:hypothetical protein n=1 Tax=Hanstruepera ponticola TaxID=2042995 RepID=UPI001786243B|nr:hypothetical protein [Hanstruepera ponticola]
MINNGFIMLNRDIMDWEWYTDVNTYKVFQHCLLKVNYSRKKWRGIVINKGEFITSYEKLAVETGLSISKVRTAIKKLKSTNDIILETFTSYSKIYVPNLSVYVADQNDTSNSTPNDKRLAKVSHTNDNQIATTNTNNIKNRIKIFREKVFTHSNFNIKILEDFFAYWSELDTNGKKMRFESQRFFEIKKRLEKWVANERPKNEINNIKAEVLTNR